jgi:uncharacterized OsmC-like protein
LAIDQELPIEALRVTVRGHILRKPPSSFRDVIFEVQLEGNVAEEKIEALARGASGYCFVENTLAKAIPVTTEVKFNGRKLLTLNKGPQNE